MTPDLTQPLDCIIIGGGPAGLAAALYLARFNRRFVIIDSDDSRVAWIPESHNIPVFAQGITGPEILRREREHVARYGVAVLQGEVTELKKERHGFIASIQAETQGGPRKAAATCVLLASGVVDIAPGIPDIAEAVQRGLVRYCPICDGYEARDKQVAVIANGNKCLGEAIFLAQTYTSDVTVLSYGAAFNLPEADRQTLADHGVAIAATPIDALTMKGSRIAARSSAARKAYEFDIVYSAFGVECRSGLATALGAAVDEDGAILIDEHCQTTIQGLYAAGDVTRSLNQIVVAMGQAAVAATAIHNYCRKQSGKSSRQPK
jgi:thioredoxin reductase (NADPH)